MSNTFCCSSITSFFRFLFTLYSFYFFINSIENITDAARLSDTIAAHLPIKHQDKQDVLQTSDANERLARLLELIQSEVEILQVEQKIRSRVKKQMERSEKEYFLNEQMRAIQKELGDRDEFKNELGELEDKVNKKNMPAEAKERVLKELKKLKLMAPMSAEATVIRNYIDWCLQLPWNDVTDDVLEIKNAESVLDEDHFGLEKPKERILEFLAVHQLVEEGGMFYRNASGALSLAYVAAGKLLGYCEDHMNAWDCLAGQLLVEEAGGIVEKQNVQKVLANGGRVIAATPAIFEDLKRITEKALE